MADGETWYDYHPPSQKKDVHETPKARLHNERTEQFNKTIITWLAKTPDEQFAWKLTATVFPGAIDFSKIAGLSLVLFSNSQFSGDARRPRIGRS